MDSNIEMGPHTGVESVPTEQALRIEFDHYCPVEKESQTHEVFHPINRGVYLRMPLCCVKCHMELRIVSQEIVEVVR